MAGFADFNDPPLSVPELIRRAPLLGLEDAIKTAHDAGDIALRSRLTARWRAALDVPGLYAGLISLSHL